MCYRSLAHGALPRARDPDPVSCTHTLHVARRTLSHVAALPPSVPAAPTPRMAARPRRNSARRGELEFYSQEFGVYQHRQLRILEFPRYASFAQSFPNTVPYSEDIGFVARVDSTDVDSTDVEGSQMLSESLSEYAALVITDRQHGRPFTQKFLRAELERYLRGRAGETKGEHPHTRVDLQAYIWYQKGSLARIDLSCLSAASPSASRPQRHHPCSRRVRTQFRRRQRTGGRPSDPWRAHRHHSAGARIAA